MRATVNGNDIPGLIRINSAACFLKPSRHPGRTVMCALNSKGAIGPPFTEPPGDLWAEMQFLCLCLLSDETETWL